MTGWRDGRVRDEFALQDSEYVDDAAFLFPYRDETAATIPLVYDHFRHGPFNIGNGSSQGTSRI